MIITRITLVRFKVGISSSIDNTNLHLVINRWTNCDIKALLMPDNKGATYSFELTHCIATVRLTIKGIS
ncbi:hypothetical protein D3C86_2097620 [compost metagenome]